MLAILITNTWTRAETIYPKPFDSVDSANKKLMELREKCSDSNGIKNNEFKVLECGVTLNNLYCKNRKGT